MRRHTIGSRTSGSIRRVAAIGDSIRIIAPSNHTIAEHQANEIRAGGYINDQLIVPSHPT